jgi:hypothetical protein
MKIALLLCATALLAAAQSVARPLVAPSAGSDAILSLRVQPEGELRLKYRKEINGSVVETVSVGIAADYHYIDSADGRRVYDYKLRRIFSVPHGTGFINNSLYAEVWSRVMQLTSRIMLARMSRSAATPTTAPPMDPFWTESELGVVSSDLPRPILTTLSNDTGLHWMLVGEEVAAVRYQKESVPQTIQGALRRLWPTIAAVHPEIADALAKSGRMPAELWIVDRSSRGPATKAHWTLTESHWEPAARFPLPAHLQAQPTIDTGSYPDIFATLATSVADKRVPITQETYKLRVEAALDRRAGLEAKLWLIEMDLARGRHFGICERDDPSSYCQLSARAERLAETDSRTSLAFMDQAPDAIDRHQFLSLPNAYVLGFLWATRPPGRGVGRSQSELDLLAALRTSAVANFCKDAGVFYASAWQPFAAWQAWDFGRLMAGHVSGDLLDSIDFLESDLLMREPALF